MGVYINMEMPKSCSRCFCMASCKIWKNIIAPEFNRHRNCPLVPVPPHGRLGDLDALYEDCALDHGYEVMATTTRINEYIQLKIDSAPTIIPAEEGE